MFPLKEIDDEIRAIRDDRLSGARKLSQKGAQVLIALAERSRAASGEEFRRELLRTGQALVKAQPSMAPLVNLVNRSLFALQEEMALEEAKRALVTTAQGYVDHLERSVERIAQVAFPLIPDGALVLTHSFSSTVLAAFLHAKQEGRTFALLCTESRPQYEGRALAERLVQAGVETQLVVDALAPSMMGGIEVVLMGADSLSTEGLVNKVGTYPLALAARAHKVPFCVLCGREKFLPVGYTLPEESPKDSQEVWPHHPQRVEVINRYFDFTPLEYLTGIVTEEGMLSPTEVREIISKRRLHPWLR
ncbi:MAG TPA: initiation factor 2B [Chloroflexi bacterium]|nr:initiation factor 2B [Chloroflexota bacterium]